MRNNKVDVIVVGAGPAGSMSAGVLARAGVKVLLLEEHKEVGSPCHCAGLVSPRTLTLADVVGQELALRSFSRARVWGPRGSVAWLESDRIQAVAIDRAALDRMLALRAEESGAHLWLGVRAESFERVRGGLQITAVNGKGREKLRTSLVIGADGVHSKVARWFDGRDQGELLPAMKLDVCFDDASTNEIEIFVGNTIAPGWFGWVIPLGNGQARLGLGARGGGLRRRFRTFLELVRDRFGRFEMLEQRGWLIPVRPSKHIAFDHALLVGDAARQAKPSSGGGIYMGMRAGVLAAEAALEALEVGNVGYQTLHRYEQAWLQEEGEELRYNHWLRSIYNRMNDAEIDHLVALCDRPWARTLIRRLGDVDFASRLFKPLHKALETIAPRLLTKLSDRLHSEGSASMEDEFSTLQLDPQSIFKGRLM
ncbi:MAG: geranylgeranyl reductase family protein [Anaerolineales bacterium]|nr:geranylgeranyl reductase family protein [Anaerolineales bacterium]